MVLPLLHLPLRSGLDGRDRNGIVTATAAGPVRFTADGYFAEEGTTNLVGNPSFAVNVTGWTGATRDTSYASMGPASGRITATGANAEATYSLTVPASQHTLSAIVKNNAASARSCQLRYNGANVGGPVVVAAGAETRISGQITGTGGAAAAGVWITDSANGETFSVGHLQVEAKGYATSPCPEMDASGAIRTGYSWAGTVHASASTRQASYLTIDEAGRIDSLQGSYAARVRRAYDRGSAGGFHNIVSVGSQTVGRDHTILYVGGTSQKPTIAWTTNGGSTLVIAASDSLSVGDRKAVYGQWTATPDMGVALETAALATAARGVPAGSMEIAGNGITIGGGTANQFDGYISDLLIFDRPLTDAERATLAATPEWSFGVLQPKLGGLLRLGMGLGLAVSSVAAVDPVAILRSGLGGSD